MPKSFTICWSILVFNCGFSQDLAVSERGRFGVQYTRGCNPFTVDIVVLDSLGDVERGFNFTQVDSIPSGDEIFNFRDITTFTYQETGTYFIGQVIDNQPIDYLKVYVEGSTEPQFDIERCSGTSFQIRSTDTTYNYLRAYFPEGDSVQLGSGETGIYTFRGSEIQQFSVRGFYSGSASCQEYPFVYTPDPLAFQTAPQVVSARLSETCRDFFNIELSIDEFDPWIAYEVILEQESPLVIFSGKLISNLINISNITYARDQGGYCVYLNAVSNCDNMSTQGEAFCAEPSAISLTPFEYLYSSYTQDGIYLSMDSVSSGFIEVYRSIDNENFELRRQTTHPFTDQTGSLSRKYFYRLDYIDSCGSVLATASTHPPFVAVSEEGKNKYQVNFTAPLSNLNGQSEILVSAGSRSLDLFSINVDPAAPKSTYQVETTPFLISLNAKDGTDRQNIWATYVLRYPSQHLSELAINSNIQTVNYDFIVYVPNAFTPNNDGLNDTLDFYGLPSNGTASIYNRWGQKIWEGTIEMNNNGASTGWDGMLNGELAPEGTYLYEIQFDKENGEKLRQKGTFVLLNQ